MFIYLISSRVISWDHVQSGTIHGSLSLHMGLFCGNDQLAVHYCILILYNIGLIKSEKHSLTMHSRGMASGRTPPEIWLEIVAAISCLHHSTWDPGLCEKKNNSLKQVLQSMHLPLADIMWNYKRLLMCSADILWSVDWRWQMAIWGQRNVSHSLIFHWWKMQQHCILA